MARKYRNTTLSGVICVNKDKGFTSHDVAAVVTKITGAKAGHTGTLDPDARGVLPVCLGKATKLSAMLTAGRKRYRAEIVLGVETDTGDASGAVISERPVTSGFDEFKSAALSFRGEYSQTPPMYSAIKQNGKKLCDLARMGKVVERAPRLVSIYDIAVSETGVSGAFALDVTCSKGTYIRSLCADIGEKLGCGAHMSRLTRVGAGNFSLEDCHSLEEIRRAADEGRLDSVVVPCERALSGYRRADADESADKLILNGNKISVSRAAGAFSVGETVALFSASGVLAGLYSVAAEGAELFLKPEVMLI